MGWRDIANNRTKAGRLLAPELIFDLMENDWSLFEVPLDFQMTPISGDADVGGNFSLEIMFPDSWEIDNTLEQDNFVLEVSLFMEAKRTGAEPEDNPRIRAVSPGGALVTPEIQTTAFVFYEVGFRFLSPLPTGLVKQNFEIQPSSGEVISVFDIKRSYGAGPDCSMRFKLGF